MPRQSGIRNRVETDHIKTDALIRAPNYKVERLFIEARVVAEIALTPPALVPAEIKEQKVRILGLLPVAGYVRKRNLFPFLQAAAINHKCLADKLRRREFVQRGAPRKEMCRRIHVRARVRVHLHQGFLKAVLLVSVCRNQLRRLRAGINRHILFDGMG